MAFLFGIKKYKSTPMRKIKMCLLGIICFAGVHAQSTQFTNKDGVAIKGYDPVAYFTLQKAIEGTDKYSFDWNGSKWKFISQANVDSFKIAPEKYAPQYGGFCAYGTSENHLSPTDPNAWTIVDNKLYLNYNMNVKQMWLKDTTKRISAADAYWPALKNQ